MDIEFTSVMQFVQANGLVIALSVAIGCIVLSVLYRGHQKTQRLTQKLQRLERELKAVNISASGMGQQIIQM